MITVYLHRILIIRENNLEAQKNKSYRFKKQPLFPQFPSVPLSSFSSPLPVLGALPFVWYNDPQHCV